jgi:hypothetical protein
MRFRLDGSRRNDAVHGRKDLTRCEVDTIIFHTRNILNLNLARHGA